MTRDPAWLSVCDNCDTSTNHTTTFNFANFYNYTWPALQVTLANKKNWDIRLFKGIIV